MVPPNPPTPAPPRRPLLGRLSLPERNYVAEALRTETVGGVLLLVAAVAALVWANTFGGSYGMVSDFHFGPGSLGLDLSVAHWAADGLLAVFFFVSRRRAQARTGRGRTPRSEGRGPPGGGGPVRHGGARPRLLPHHGRRWRLDGRLGGPHSHRHRLRPRRPRGDRHLAAVRAAGLPAHPGRRRRPLRDPDHRGVLHLGPELPGARRGCPRPGRLLPPPPPRRPGLVRLHPARPGHLGPDVQQRHPRHHRRMSRWA